MEKISKNKSIILMISGILVLSASSIISHYIELPDLLKGFLIGIGIGLLLSFLFRNIKTLQ